MTCIKIWDATGAYHQKFNNSVTFAALTVKFYTLQLPSAPLFPCAFSSAADKRPVRTDISIAQKTCVFRPVDISVAAAKRSKLIYQSVYSLLGTELPQSKPDGFASSLWEGAFGMAGVPLPSSPAAMPPSPRGSVLALSVTCGDSSPKGRALGIAAKFSVKP